jgi:hypothetical protein
MKNLFKKHTASGCGALFMGMKSNNFRFRPFGSESMFSFESYGLKSLGCIFTPTHTLYMKVSENHGH